MQNNIDKLAQYASAIAAAAAATDDDAIAKAKALDAIARAIEIAHGAAINPGKIRVRLTTDEYCRQNLEHALSVERSPTLGDAHWHCSDQSPILRGLIEEVWLVARGC